MSTVYPYIVVRILGAVFQREDIAILQGSSAVHVGFRSSYIHHPQPFTPCGAISPGCKELLVVGVMEAVRRTGLRMCLVWAPNACTYCEKDGKAYDRDDPPSGGFGSGGVDGTPLPSDIQFDRRTPLTNE